MKINAGDKSRGELMVRRMSVKAQRAYYAESLDLAEWSDGTAFYRWSGEDRLHWREASKAEIEQLLEDIDSENQRIADEKVGGIND